MRVRGESLGRELGAPRLGWPAWAEGEEGVRVGGWGWQKGRGVGPPAQRNRDPPSAIGGSGDGWGGREAVGWPARLGGREVTVGCFWGGGGVQNRGKPEGNLAGAGRCRGFHVGWSGDAVVGARPSCCGYPRQGWMCLAPPEMRKVPDCRRSPPELLYGTASKGTCW